MWKDFLSLDSGALEDLRMMATEARPQEGAAGLYRWAET